MLSERKLKWNSCWCREKAHFKHVFTKGEINTTPKNEIKHHIIQQTVTDWFLRHGCLLFWWLLGGSTTWQMLGEINWLSGCLQWLDVSSCLSCTHFLWFRNSRSRRMKHNVQPNVVCWIRWRISDRQNYPTLKIWKWRKLKMKRWKISFLFIYLCFQRGEVQWLLVSCVGFRGIWWSGCKKA